MSRRANKFVILTGTLLATVALSLAALPLFGGGRQWTLTDCVDTAIARNITVNQQDIVNDINRINYRQSKYNLYPNLNFSDQHELDFGRYINPATGVYLKGNSSINSPTLTSSVTLFNGSRNFSLIKENQLACDAGKLDLEQLKNNIALDVIAAYLQVLYQHEAVGIAEYQAKATAEQVEYTRKYVAAGNKLPSALYQAEAQLAANRAAVTSAQNQLQLAKVTLMQLMQMPVTNDFDVLQPDSAEVTPAPVLQSSTDIYSIAEGILPDVKSARTKTAASLAALEVTKTERIPRLTLSGSLASEYSSLASLPHTTEQLQNIGYVQNIPSEQVVGPGLVTTTSSYPFFSQMGDNFSQSLSLTLSVPIFNNMLYKSDIERAKLAVSSSRLNETLAENTLRQSIEQAYTDQVAACKNYIATKEQLAYEEKYYNDLEKQLRQGMATMTDYLVGQNNYFGAVEANVQARYEYLFKTRVLAFYTGTLIR